MEVIRGLPIHLDDKIWMLLVCIDLIPAWEIEVNSEDGDGKVDKLNTGLIDAGFEIQVAEKKIYYANLKQNLDRLAALNGHMWGEDHSKDVSASLEYGTLYGYPQMAVEAFSNQDDTIGRWDLPPEITSQDFIFLTQYALSRENWPEEIKTAQRWAEALQEKAPELWQQYLEIHKELRAENYRDRPEKT